jgi:glutamate--cysteine ligase
LARNQHRTAAFGRQPELTLERDGRDTKLADWGAEIIEGCTPLAARLDEVHDTTDYGDAVRAAEAVLQNPDMLSSARVLAAMARDHQNSFAAFTLAQSEQSKAKLLKLPYAGALHAKLEAVARQSVSDQQAVEAGDSMPFENYRQQYISPERLGLTREAVAPALAAV